MEIFIGIYLAGSCLSAGLISGVYFEEKSLRKIGIGIGYASLSWFGAGALIGLALTSLDEKP